MSNKELGEDDTSDEDFNPDGEDCAQLSEEESDGEPENNCNSDDEVNNKQKKRKSKTKANRNKKAKVNTEETEEKPQNTELNEEELKKRTDSLWADFLKDTDFKPKPKPSTDTKTTVETICKPANKNDKPTKILEFAGEIVNIPQKSTDISNVKQGSSQVSSTTPTANVPSKKGRGGISSVLNQLGKKQKITTLEKSKLDWDNFKQQENITEELQTYNKGKNGYLERQDFLQRADLRQFEIEKQARAVQRSHRS